MLILTRKFGEKIRIGDRVIVTILEGRGEHVKIGIEAPQSVRVYRQEVYEEILNENKIASTSKIDKLNISIDL